MKVTILQHDIDWCRVDHNLSHLDELIKTIPKTDLLLLPEMFATGLNNVAADIVDAQPRILEWMKQKARDLDAAVVGSIATQEDGINYNRLHFVKPDGSVIVYDKHHLFAYGGEAQNYSRGNRRVVVEFRGVRFLLQVCYDLRYPLWARQRGDYDCILYSANFPISRDTAWRTLIRARAIENQCYVAACNRIGTDQQCEYYGRSAIIHPYGETIMDCPDKTEWAASAEIDLDFLRHYEAKFPVLADADPFELVNRES
ncbi:MAG: amidohydrolase [Bacteroidaceae bacterium]|nr:amidohydrolase [Bacteroidaceae bacterium]